MVLVSIEVEEFFPYNTQLKRMDVVCRVSEKYFALTLYRLFSAEMKERSQGNVNSICC